MMQLWYYCHSSGSYNNQHARTSSAGVHSRRTEAHLSLSIAACMHGSTVFLSPEIMTTKRRHDQLFSFETALVEKHLKIGMSRTSLYVWTDRQTRQTGIQRLD